jgi:hypothetical protein
VSIAANLVFLVPIASFLDSLFLVMWFALAAAFLAWIVRAWLGTRGRRR